MKLEELLVDQRNFVHNLLPSMRKAMEAVINADFVEAREICPASNNLHKIIEAIRRYQSEGFEFAALQDFSDEHVEVYPFEGLIFDIEIMFLGKSEINEWKAKFLIFEHENRIVIDFEDVKL